MFVLTLLTNKRLLGVLSFSSSDEESFFLLIFEVLVGLSIINNVISFLFLVLDRDFLFWSALSLDGDIFDLIYDFFNVILYFLGDASTRKYLDVIKRLVRMNVITMQSRAI